MDSADPDPLELISQMLMLAKSKPKETVELLGRTTSAANGRMHDHRPPG
jgi:hypothetical protein